MYDVTKIGPPPESFHGPSAIIDRVLTYIRGSASEAPPKDSTPAGRALILGALILIGFVVRVWQLGGQSLWLDEALSVIFSRPSLREVISILVTDDLHPPLYYVALHLWIRAAGSTEFAARFVSLIFGLPAIPATYVLGSALFRENRSSGYWSDRGRQIGLVAALLVTVSPFLVYYSQEARMYSALATFGLLSSLALWKLLDEPGRRWWVAYVIFTAAVIYTQYFGALVIIFQAIYLLGIGVRERRKAVIAFSALAAAAVLYVPWIPGAMRQIQRLITIPDFWKGDFPVSYLLTHVFAAFALGQFVAMKQFAGVAAGAGILVVGGLTVLTWRAMRRGGGEIYVLTYLIVPMVLLYIVVARNPKFAERYLIMIAPPFYLVIALSFVTVARWLGTVKLPSLRRSGQILLAGFGVALVGASILQIWQIYYGPTYRKDDNRGAIAYIESHAQSGDVVVLMMNTYQSYQYYGRGDVPWEALQPGGDAASAAQRLNEITAGRHRMWLLLWNAEWADPTGYVRQSLDQAYRQEPVTESFAGLGLRLYDVNPSYRFSVKTTPNTPRPVNFGNKVRLLGYDLDQATVAAGKSSRITLFWEALGPLDADFIVSLRLRDKLFYWWRHDDRPAAFNFPTMYWRPGQVVTGDIQIQVPPGTPPGSYDVEVGVYGQGQGQDLNVLTGGGVATGTAASVATLTVTRPTTPPDVSSLDIPTRPDVQFGSDLRLVGVNVPTTQSARGGTLDVTLWWQAMAAALPEYRVRLLFANGSFERVLSEDLPVSGHYGTSHWGAGEVVVDRHRLTIPSDAPAGAGKISLQIWPAGGAGPVSSNHGSTVVLGTTTVLDRQRLTTLPDGIQTPSDWRIGNFAQLVGYSLSPATAGPGDHLKLTLYWKATGSSGGTPYTVFAHLLDRNQLVKAQQDHPPGDGDNPTSGWTDGEYIVDHYDLVVAADAAPGAYDLEVGMYDSVAGKRAAVSDLSGNSVGDRAVIAKVQVG